MAKIFPPPNRDGHPADGPRRLSAGQRRLQLFDVALSLFAARGYRSTTMDDIAEAAGVTKPLLYQHFSSKRALYLELVETAAQSLVHEIAQATSAAAGPRQQVEDGFAAYFRFLVAHQAAFRLLYGRDAEADDPELGNALRKVEDTIAMAIDPLIDAGLDDEHRRLLSYAVVGMAEGASRHWIQNGRQSASHQAPPTDGGAAEPARRMAARVADLAWAGLRSVHAD